MKTILYYDENTEVEVDWPVQLCADDVVVFDYNGNEMVTVIKSRQHNLLTGELIYSTLEWNLVEE